MIFQSVIVGDVLYTLGGTTSDNKPSNAVYAAPLNALSTYQLKWQQLADTPCAYSAAVNLNNKYLLAVGGSGHKDTVCVLKREKGSLITSTLWVSIGSLPDLRDFPSAISLANQIIVIRGYDWINDLIDTVAIGTFH